MSELLVVGKFFVLELTRIRPELWKYALTQSDLNHMTRLGLRVKDDMRIYSWLLLG